MIRIKALSKRMKLINKNQVNKMSGKIQDRINTESRSALSGSRFLVKNINFARAKYLFWALIIQYEMKTRQMGKVHEILRYTKPISNFISGIGNVIPHLSILLKANPIDKPDAIMRISK